MISKKMTAGVLCSVVAGALALAPVAKAQDTMMSTTTTTTMSNDASMTPMAVTGTVVRYYVDRAGYVSAMDIQTANGIEMVRFSPGMGNRLYNTYPVGGQASVYVVGSPTTRWDVVGMGATAPTTMMAPQMLSDVQLLDSEPYILAGTKLVTKSGKLSDLIVNDQGEVVGMILDNSMLVRVPREVRNIAPGAAGTERVAGLFKGADVEVTGYPEAPRYGVLSSFTDRIAANALVVNGRAVGSIGVPMMSREMTESVFNVNVGGTDRTAEELRAQGMGYTTYMPMSSGAGMTNGTMSGGMTSGGTMSGGTMQQ
ncbi:MAG TPA: hypothetical protein VF681_01785 [Abditibacteriaceae bacterium]|jgi:hypothetical protein